MNETNSSAIGKTSKAAARATKLYKTKKGGLDSWARFYIDLPGLRTAMWDAFEILLFKRRGGYELMKLVENKKSRSARSGFQGTSAGAFFFWAFHFRAEPSERSYYTCPHIEKMSNIFLDRRERRKKTISIINNYFYEKKSAPTLSARRNNFM